MATYAIGDIQGCFDAFQALLEKIKFNKEKDQLWLAGDMINRGPQSLETLRYIISLGDAAKVVLGNHECHALAVFYGHKEAHRSDTFQDIINAPDADELFNWIRTRPFFYQDKQLGYSMIHAGLPPQWTLKDAKKNASELEAVLAGEYYQAFFADMYGSKPKCWEDKLTGQDRLRFIINSFTRTRYCDASGKMDFKEKGRLGSQPEHLLPWFDVPNRKTKNKKIVFGHWSTIGIHKQNNTSCLDSGCLWGGSLSAMVLDGSEKVISVDCKSYLKPF